jgi:pimeloyl-ACP methyl ester carboxylesterase
MNPPVALHARPDQTDTLRGIAVPMLVLCGREDRSCPVARHTMMHDVAAGSMLEIVEGAGLLPTLAQPEAATAALACWLERE